jgi:hypothetical protein
LHVLVFAASQQSVFIGVHPWLIKKSRPSSERDGAALNLALARHCRRPVFANPVRIEIIQPRVGPSRMGEELPWINRSEHFPTLKGLHRLAHELIQPFQGCGRLVSLPGVATPSSWQHRAE